MDNTSSCRYSNTSIPPPELVRDNEQVLNRRKVRNLCTPSVPVEPNKSQFRDKFHKWDLACYHAQNRYC